MKTVRTLFFALTLLLTACGHESAAPDGLPEDPDTKSLQRPKLEGGTEVTNPYLGGTEVTSPYGRVVTGMLEPAKQEKAEVAGCPFERIVATQEGNQRVFMGMVDDECRFEVTVSPGNSYSFVFQSRALNYRPTFEGGQSTLTVGTGSGALDLGTIHFDYDLDANMEHIREEGGRRMWRAPVRVGN